MGWQRSLVLTPKPTKKSVNGIGMTKRIRELDDNNTPERVAFDNLVDRVLAVPHTEILRREKDYQEQAAQNPKRRGPKRKVKSSAVVHESTDKD